MWPLFKYFYLLYLVFLMNIESASSQMLKENNNLSYTKLKYEV